MKQNWIERKLITIGAMSMIALSLIASHWTVFSGAGAG